MDGKKKKRQMEDVEDDEEQKIELFFALVKSTREVHEKLKKGERKGIQKANEDKPPTLPVVWNPCFRPEDFMEDAVLLKAAGCGSSTGVAVIPRTSFCERGEKEEKYLMEEVEPPPVPVPVSVAAAGTRKREDKEFEDDEGGDTGLDLNLSL